MSVIDETSDVSSKFRFVVVLVIYCLLESQLKGFGNDASSLFVCIKNILPDVVREQKQKVISQSYDNVRVMSGQHAGVQTVVR